MKNRLKNEKILSTIVDMDNALFCMQSRLSVAQKINKEDENKKAVDMLIDEAIKEISNLRLKRGY